MATQLTQQQIDFLKSRERLDLPSINDGVLRSADNGVFVCYLDIAHSFDPTYINNIHGCNQCKLNLLTKVWAWVQENEVLSEKEVVSKIEIAEEIVEPKKSKLGNK